MVTMIAGERIRTGEILCVGRDGKLHVWRHLAERYVTAIRDFEKDEVVPIDPETGRAG